MNIKTLHKNYPWSVVCGQTGHERDSHFTICENTCVWFHGFMCMEKSQDPRSFVWSFGIPQQAVRWHSLHIRNSYFVLTCPGIEQSAGLQARISPTPHSRLNGDQQQRWQDHRQAKGGGTVVVVGKCLQLAGKWKVNIQLTRFYEWFFAARMTGKMREELVFPVQGSGVSPKASFCGLQIPHCLHPWQWQS